MKIPRAMWGAIALLALVAGVARAQDDPGLLAFIAQGNQRCEELKQKKAEIEHQASQSQGVSREQRAQATKTIAELGKAIEATTTLLHDPSLTGNGDKKEIAARLQFAIAQGNMLARSAQRELGVGPRTAIDRVLDSNIANFTTKVSPGFDGARKASDGGESTVYAGGTGTRFFGIGGNNSAPVAVAATYTRTTSESAEALLKHDKSIGGGVMLEDAAEGLGPVTTVRYDGRFNALVMDDRLVYFMKVPPWDAAALCREILLDQNMLVGVSLGKTPFVFGDNPKIYADTDLVHDLLLTDHFLGDLVFGWHVWTMGYKLPDGYAPKTAEVKSDMLVRFAFKNFQFTRKGGELRLVNLAFTVTMMPVSKVPAKNGGMLPDLDALKQGYEPPQEFLENAQYVTSHFDFLRQERIVDKTVAYGELAALFRSYKMAHVDLETLALALMRG